MSKSKRPRQPRHMDKYPDREPAPENTNDPKAPTTQKHVAEQVHAVLGTPENHYDSVVHFYHGNKARINVRCRRTGTYEVHITDSFYLWLEKDGTIASSNPPIKQRYELAG